MMRTQWPNPKELDELNRLFSFNYTGQEQDWEIEFAAPERIEEFLDAYETESLNDSQKMAVMDLIIASYDELLNENPGEAKYWQRISGHLKSNYSIHKYSIEYWSCLEAVGEDQMFDVTERIRGIGSERF
jgi:hypothetical protein